MPDWNHFPFPHPNPDKRTGPVVDIVASLNLEQSWIMDWTSSARLLGTISGVRYHSIFCGKKLGRLSLP